MEQILLSEGWEIDRIFRRKKFLGIRLTHNRKTPISIYCNDYDAALEVAMEKVNGYATN